MTELFITSVNFWLLLIPLVFTIHEIEEWNILKWYRKHYRDMPSSTNRSIRLWIIFISLIIFCLSILAIFIQNNIFIFSPIFVFISAFILVNVIQHIIWTIQYRDYSIGLVTAVLVFIVIIMAHLKIIESKMINKWFYIIGIYMIIPIIKTIKSPHVMTSEIRSVHNLGISIEEFLFKTNEK